MALRRKRSRGGISIVNPESVPKAWEHLVTNTRTTPVITKPKPPTLKQKDGRTTPVTLKSRPGYETRTLSRGAYLVPATPNMHLVDVTTSEIVQSWYNVGSLMISEYNSNVLTDGSLLVNGNPGPSCDSRYMGLHRYDKDSNCVWSFNIQNFLDNEINPLVGGYLGAHHDAWPLDNGNILIHGSHFINATPWGRGSNFESGFIMEIQPVGQNDANMLWQWWMEDHFIQDKDPSKEGYVIDVSNYPHMIDINLPSESNPGGTDNDGNFSHFNTIHYNPDLDAVVISSRTIGYGGGGENFIIQREYPYGGRIIWRCCNSENYGVVSPQLTRHQHGANWIPPNWPHGGDMVIFSNSYYNYFSNEESSAAVLKISNIPYVFNCDNEAPCEEARDIWHQYEWNIYSGPEGEGSIICYAQCGAFSLPDGNLWVATHNQGFEMSNYWPPYEVENPWDGGSVVWESEEITEPRPIRYVYGCTEDVCGNYDTATPYMLVYDDDSCYSPYCSCLLGDINCDGGWNVLDIVALANCVLAENCHCDYYQGEGNGVSCSSEAPWCCNIGTTSSNNNDKRYGPPPGMKNETQTAIIQKVLDIATKPQALNNPDDKMVQQQIVEMLESIVMLGRN